MRLSAWTNFILGLVLVLVIIGLLYKVWLGHENPPPIPSGAFIPASYNSTVLAIDLNTDRKFNYKNILNGEDGILVVHENPDLTHHGDDIIESEAVLATLDSNSDGRIDAIDPIYNKLELLFFDHDKNNNFIPRFVPLSKAGIRVVFLDKKYLSRIAQKQVGSLSYIPGSIIMSDGSFRLIQDVSVYNFPSLQNSNSEEKNANQ